MDTNILVFDNFYEDPDSVRENTLKRSFEVRGNYPGARTEPEAPEQREYLKEYFTSHIVKKDIKYWPGGYNTAFQYSTADSKTWIHHDNTDWAGVLYLSPDAPAESGTGIYRHKASGIYEWDRAKPETDLNEEDYLGDDSMDQWEQIAFVGNVYNRLVVYRGTLYHRSVLPGFGTDKHTGRLFQTFFFDTV